MLFLNIFSNLYILMTSIFSHFNNHSFHMKIYFDTESKIVIALDVNNKSLCISKLLAVLSVIQNDMPTVP